MAALRDGYEAGADVPRPLTCSAIAILMEFIGDRTGAAPILHGLKLPADEAGPLLDRLLVSVERLLERHRIHGDLSAYNVLYRDGQATIIDLPQAIDAIRHPSGFELLTRDLDRLCRYFKRQGVSRDPLELAVDPWARCLGRPPG